MGYLSQFNLPVKNWITGYHQVVFDIDDRFFGQFEGGLIDNGQFDVSVQANKLSDSIVLFIDYKGFTRTSCDRCLAPIDLPLNGHTEYLIKLGDAESDDGNVITINRDKSDWNVAGLIWDAVNLGMPINRTYDCDQEVPRPCDDTVLNKLNTYAAEDEDDPGLTPWNTLAGIQFEEE